MKRTRNLVLLGVAIYFFVLLKQFPADVAVGLAAPDSVKLYGVSGTIWDGRAEAIAPPGGLTLGQTDWRVSGLWLLTGRLKGEFGTQLDDTSRLNGQFSKPLLGQSLSLSNAQGILDLALLPADLRPNGVTGRVGLSFDRVALDALWPTAAQGSINLVDLTLARPSRIELGTFEVSFDGSSEDPLVGTVTDTRSDISVDGTLTLAADRSYVFDAMAAAGPGANRQVADALPMLGPTEPDGRVSMSFSGTVD